MTKLLETVIVATELTKAASQGKLWIHIHLDETHRRSKLTRRERSRLDLANLYSRLC